MRAPSSCKTYLTAFEQLTIDGFLTSKGSLISYLNAAFNQGRIGKKKLSTKEWDLSNDVLYFNIYLYLMKLKIQEDNRNGKLKTANEYHADFKIDCIRKHFNCMVVGTGLEAFDIDKLLKTYGVDKDSINAVKLGGIGYMALEIDDNNNPIFEIG